MLEQAEAQTRAWDSPLPPHLPFPPSPVAEQPVPRGRHGRTLTYDGQRTHNVRQEELGKDGGDDVLEPSVGGVVSEGCAGRVKNERLGCIDVQLPAEGFVETNLVPHGLVEGVEHLWGGGSGVGAHSSGRVLSIP